MHHTRFHATLVMLETLSRVYTPCDHASQTNSVFDFRGWTLSWTTSYLSHMQADGVQRAPSLPPYRNATLQRFKAELKRSTEKRS